MKTVPRKSFNKADNFDTVEIECNSVYGSVDRDSNNLVNAVKDNIRKIPIVENVSSLNKENRKIFISEKNRVIRIMENSKTLSVQIVIVKKVMLRLGDVGNHTETSLGG